MRKTGKTRAAKTATLETTPAQPAREADEVMEADTLWPIAMLRIAMELKRPEAPGLDEIITGVVKKMGIPKAQFEKYIAEHLGTLKEAAKKNGYAR
ncbi:MAG TPA: hypothetical protein VGK67_33170 [Myxococcales bacterium]|jgi:hypothetical protein